MLSPLGEAPPCTMLLTTLQSQTRRKIPTRVMLTKEEDAFGTTGALWCCDGLP